MENQNDQRHVVITQIAIDPGEPGYNCVIYGVSVDGEVYEYVRGRGWRPLLTCEIPPQ